jgi:hypothetical protein
MIKYTCECIKKSEFVQCQRAKDTGANIKCKPVTKRVDRISTNYCEGHLVYPTAKKITFRTQRSRPLVSAQEQTAGTIPVLVAGRTVYDRELGPPVVC